MLPQFDPIFKASELHDEAIAAIRKAGARGDLKKATELVTDELMGAMSIIGDVNECRRRLNRFRAAGVNLPVIVPHGDRKGITDTITHYTRI